MKYKNLAKEIINHKNNPNLEKFLETFLGKILNQERIQIYKTLLIYFSELSDENKKYLIKKIDNNEAILKEREDILEKKDFIAHFNEFFDLSSENDVQLFTSNPIVGRLIDNNQVVTTAININTNGILLTEEQEIEEAAEF